jgi:UDP-N-acetylglucosamine 2-epimerase (non-hydrolysing)
MISRLACLHFAPTSRAAHALRREGIDEGGIVLTGNTVVDAQHWTCERYGIRRQPGARGDILVTVHRREHWGQEMEDIFAAVADIARAFPQQRITFPVHLNPVVQQAAHAVLDGVPNVALVPPMDYLAMQKALAEATLVLTDSGGIQEEAPTFGVPVLVLRHETERPEAVEAGCACLVGPDRTAIVREVTRLLTDDLAYRRMQQPANPYGDGLAAGRICEAIARELGLAEVRNRPAAAAA